MPIPLAALAPIIMAGGTLVAGGAGILANRKRSLENMQLQYWQNKENWKQQNEMYDKQRQDALADWAAQNSYNHPLEQMNRLRQAGLNPNLVYGKGADVTAESIRASQAPAINRPAPQNTFDPSAGLNQMAQGLNQGLMAYYDLKGKQAQIDNVQQSTALMQQEALFKQANTAKTISDTARTNFDLQQSKELKDSVIENARLQNTKLQADTMYTIDNNRRSELANSSNVQLTLEKIISEKIAHAKDNATVELLQQQLENVKQSNDIMRYEQQLSAMGIHKTDPWYFRALMNLINGNMSNPLNEIMPVLPSNQDIRNRTENNNFGQGMPWNKKK